MAMAILFCLMIFGLISNSDGLASIQVPIAGNCHEDTVLTCHVSGNIGYTGWFRFNRNIMINGNPVRQEDQNKFTEFKGKSSFTLTIHNTDINDVGDYRCRNGSEESLPKRLNIECKASSATYSVTRGKKLQITVDKLYPASPTFTNTFERQNRTIHISASTTCSSSTQYSGYFRCVWKSSHSLDDGLYTYSLVVTTITRSSPLTGSFKIVSPGLLSISNIVNLNVSREVLYGNVGQPLTIQCTSNGGYPVQTVTWYKNNITTSNQLATRNIGTLQSDGTYTVNLQHTFTPVASDERKYLICRSYYQYADSAQVGSNSKSVLFYLTLMPSKPTTTQASVVSAGNDVGVRCRTTGCRPPASISWLYRGVRYNGSTISTFDAKTETFTVKSTYTRQVIAADNGQSIQCIVTHPALPSPRELTKSINLNVQYPPDVTVTTTNMTVKVPTAIIACNAKGVPNNNYRYGKWIHTWPGYNIHLSERPGSERLKLTDLTYEHSGLYTCSASNGIKVFGTNKDFIEGSSYIVVKSFPIIIKFSEKVTAKLNERLNVEIIYYSNTGESDVKLYKNVNGSRQTAPGYSLSKTNKVIDLPVFTHTIKTNGTKAVVSFNFMSKEDMGYFDIIVSNEVDSVVRSFEIDPKGSAAAVSSPFGGILGGTVTSVVVIALMAVIIVHVRRKTSTKDGSQTQFQTIFSSHVSRQSQQDLIQQSEMDIYTQDNDAHVQSNACPENSSDPKNNSLNVYEKLQHSASENRNAYDVIKVKKEATIGSKMDYENLKLCSKEEIRSKIKGKLSEENPRIYENLKTGVKTA